MATVIKIFHCYDCETEFEVSINHKINKHECVECSSENTEVMLQPAIIAKVGGPKTLGSLAEENSKKNPLTKEKVFEKSENHEKVKEKAKIDKLGRMTKDQQRKYIETGKM